MANKEHLKKAKEGVEVWNAWRESNDDKPDLAGADLSGADLSDANLSDARLQGANLSGADLYCANLSGANLSGANLSSADLRGADISDATLINTDLRKAHLSGANLSHTNLEGANLGGAQIFTANLSKAVLLSANLIDAKLQGANLNNATFFAADLRGAVFEGADLRGGNLNHADLNGAKLHGATHLNLIGARNYSLDGIDISTWVIPPAPLLPSFNKGRLVLPYSDPWSSVRRTYTGVMTAFHLLLAATALAPYLLRAIIADAAEYGMPRFAVALGYGRPDAWLLVPTGILLVAYNLIRMLSTWWLSQLREEEARSGHAPEKSQYWGFWLLHKFLLRWVGYLALVMGFWRTIWWLSEKV